MRPQVSRLLVLFALLLLGFIFLWTWTTPESFGEYGFFRGDALKEIQAQPPKFAGKQACLDCHSDLEESTQHFQVGVSCETCHGPALEHVKDFEKFKPSIPEKREFCGRCHGKNIARPSDFPQIDLSEHNPSEPCTSCHAIHE
ncbi:MAG TPA: cytochrome c3 family protein [Fimbriimonadales bacterium]|nr:cytochrome c3 family protein [Fimbriimonadales bacterium]